MDELVEKRPEKGKRTGNSQTVMDSRKEGHYAVDNDEIYLVVVTVFAGDVRGGRKSSPNRKPSCGEFRRPICGATSGGSKNGLYF